MGDYVPTHPRLIEMGCVECEEQQQFKAVDGSVEAMAARYRCEECGHDAELHLDPQ